MSEKFLDKRLRTFEPTTDLVGNIPDQRRTDVSVGRAKLIAADSDASLVLAFLGRGGLSDRSVQNAEKELHRFLLWCRDRNLTLPELRTEHLMAYSGFLTDPQPKNLWISETIWPRSSPLWRPFKGPLSTSSHRQAMIAVRSLFAWATEASYLPANPAALLGKMKAPGETRVKRYLPKDAVEILFAASTSFPTRTKPARIRSARNRFLIVAYYTTGARLAELVAANMGDIYQEDERWWLDVIGKGAKSRRLPVTQSFLTAYEAYRAAYGFSRRTTRDDKTPLILTSRGEYLRATEGTVSIAVKRVLRSAAKLADTQGNSEAAASLTHASTHWLRHSVFTHLANSGVSLVTVQETAGHAKLSTTGLYLHKKDKERHDEITASLDAMNSFFE